MQPSNLVLLSSQVALSQAMDVVANNVANASTAGFKREGIQFDTYVAKLGTNKQPLKFVIDRATYRDASNGALVPTGNTLDVAIQGAGYFRVKMPDGSTGFTRGGSLLLDHEGQLVTQAGLPLIDDAGQTITLPDTTTQVNISADGFITARVDTSSDLAQIGKINLVGFANEQTMQPAGAGIYTTDQTPQPVPDSQIVQGSIEQSNVQPLTEINNMIEIMRAYEQVTNIISNANDRSTNANDKLSKTTV